MLKILQSDSFKINTMFWKIFGLWPGKEPSKYYIVYSASYLFITFVVYNILLTLNLMYTPRKIEILIREVIFYFTEVAVAAKVLMVLSMRREILNTFDLLDCEPFEGDDFVGKKIVEKNIQNYKFCYKIYSIISNVAYSCQVVVPIFLFLILGSNLELPICMYYFLEDEIRQRYFVYFFLYQSFGMYGHMMYNVNIDSFIAGLILMAITQLRIINHKLTNLKFNSKLSLGTDENNQMSNLNECLKHYDLVIKYCSNIQKILSVTIFIQFGMASTIICVVLCGLLLLPSSTEAFIFLVFYLFVMTAQIFVPAWLGTILSFESQKLVFAAYNSEWISRSEMYKRSLRLFVERAKTAIVLKGLIIFPLSLGTFTSIMKTAYSFFTLVRNVQDRQK